MPVRSLRFSAIAAAVLAAAVLPSQLAAQNITVQQPAFGVVIDADGVLSVKQYADPSGKLIAKRVAAAKAAMPGDILRKSDLRKVSLVKLERALAEKLAAGAQPDDAMKHLAGLQRAQYVFFYPEEKDIVIAGPAEGWVEDLSGRAVGLTTGRPTLLLDDLAVALRAYPPLSEGKPQIGCTIEPSADGLQKLVAFQKTIPRAIPQSQRGPITERIVQGVRESLGMSNIRVFGVSEKTHFAQVLIEADHRMKLIGIGLEPPPVKMVTFISALDSPRMSIVQRWWFTPDYDCVKVSQDRLAMELVGQGVKLQNQDMSAGPDGRLQAVKTPPSRASELYTRAFTEKYEQIATRAPVYAQLRNMIDLVVAAAFIRDEGYYGRAEWRQGALADESRLRVETLANPRQVQSSINVLWKGNRLLVPAGGVSLHPDEALHKERIQPDADGRLGARRETVRETLPEGRWWWD